MCNQSETGFLTEKPGVANKVGRKKRTFLKKSIWSFISGCSTIHTQKKGDAIDLFLSRKCRKKKGVGGYKKIRKNSPKIILLFQKPKINMKNLPKMLIFVINPIAKIKSLSFLKTFEIEDDGK